MKQIKLSRININNFKGIKKKIIDFENETTISGMNATGKTTVIDAVNWLLFDKDSTGKADFQLKPVDTDGKEINNLSIEVRANFLIDEKEVTLHKIFVEKYTKKRGSTHKNFTGHTTKHFIDDVPNSQKEYNDFIHGIVDQKIFKLVTNPFEFASLHWQERRTILFQISSMITDFDIINSDPELIPLVEICDGKPVDDIKKKIAAQKKKINDELDDIPVRIDELSISIHDISAPSEKDKKVFEDYLELYRKELAEHSVGSLANKKRSALNALLLQISEDDLSQANEKQGKIEAYNKQVSTLNREISDIAIADTTQAKRLIGVNEKRMSELREDFATTNAVKQTAAALCPTCGADLPEEKRQEAIEAFNLDKATRLQNIQTEGLTRKTENDGIKKDIEATEKQNAINQKLIAEKETEKQNVLSAIAAAQRIPETDGLQDLRKQKEILKAEIKGLEENTTDSSGIQLKIDDYQKRIDEWNESYTAFEAIGKSKARIKELKASEKMLSKEFERLDQQLNLIEKFIVAKCHSVENSVNEKFSMAQFKLFDVQVNQGIKECCEVLCNGVPFNKGLNNGARINTGLDIIKTLSDFYQIQAPIFIDNAESVNEIISTGSQMVKFVVNDKKKLTVG